MRCFVANTSGVGNGDDGMKKLLLNGAKAIISIPLRATSTYYVFGKKPLLHGVEGVFCLHSLLFYITESCFVWLCFRTFGVENGNGDNLLPVLSPKNWCSYTGLSPPAIFFPFRITS